MRHFFRNDHGNLHQAAYLGILEPSRLVDHFLDPILADGVGVGSTVAQELPDGLPSMGRMAVFEVFPDQIPMAGKGLIPSAPS